MIVPPLNSKERFEAQHATIGRQIETLKKTTHHALGELEQLIRAAIYANKALVDDLEDFKVRRTAIMSSFDVVCLMHGTGITSNRYVHKRLNCYIMGFHVFYREFKERYVDLM